MAKRGKSPVVQRLAFVTPVIDHTDVYEFAPCSTGDAVEYHVWEWSHGEQTWVKAASVCGTEESAISYANRRHRALARALGV